MVPEKSSIGEISSKISWRPDLVETSSPSSRRFCDVAPSTPRCRPASRSCWSGGRGAAEPRGVRRSWRRRCGGGELSTVGAVLLLREAAKRGPSEGSRTHRPTTPTHHQTTFRVRLEDLRADAKIDH